MSKKKASGNTMTLKDFHGGSIPSDLPLPSAPGVVPVSTDRPGYERSPWVSPMGRPEQRTRPNSSPSIRHFDDKTPFLSHTAMGRNFDEDERKPVDGLSAPRRMVSDDCFRVPNSRAEVKSELVSTGRVTGSHRSASSGGLGTCSAYSGISSQMVEGKGENSSAGAYPNAWGVKEVTVGRKEPVQLAWAGETAVSKLVHASAVDKVTSGRWQSRVSLANVEVIKHFEPEIGCSKNHDDILAKERESSDVMLGRHVERSLCIEERVEGGTKGSPDYEKIHALAYGDVTDGKPTTHTDGFQTTCSDGRSVGSEMQPMVASEVSERPRLKLQSRTKPLVNVEKHVIDPIQEHQSIISVIGHTETDNILQRNMNSSKPVLDANEANQSVERPKLYLKPRTQPFEKSEGKPKGERNSLFGGARPRELVLKERGIDDIKGHEPIQHSDRVNRNVAKTERVPSQPILSSQGERPETVPHDMRTARKFERKKDNRGDVDRPEFQRRNKPNYEVKRNNHRENERQQQAMQERPPSPETWRKPIVPPKPASPEGSGLRYGKAASAVELAQAFSKPFSGPKEDDPYNVRSGIPSRTQVPFSRLMSPGPRQINGY